MDDKGRLFDNEGKLIKDFGEGVSGKVHFNNVSVSDKNNQWTLCDLDGNAISKIMYGHINNTGYGTEVLLSLRGEKLGYLDTSGNEVVECRWDGIDVLGFSEGLAYVEKDGKFGFIDTKGQMVIEPQWDDARGFHEGLAAVEQDSKWGYIDKSGKLVIPYFNAESAERFESGMAGIFLDDGNCYAINRIGEKIPREGQFVSTNTGVAKIFSGNDGAAAYSREGKLICYSSGSLDENYLIGCETLRITSP